MYCESRELCRYGWKLAEKKITVPKMAYEISSPDFELRAGCKVGGELLDERQQNGLAERAGVLTKHLLRVDGLAHIQDQVQICR